MVLFSYFSPLTWTCLRRTTSSSHLATLPLAARSRACSGTLVIWLAAMRSSSARTSSGTSSSETQRVDGLAAMCSAMSRANAVKSSFLATKSVLQSTSTSTPTLPLAWM